MEIRLHQRRVLRNGKDVKLSRYEYGVLVFLAQRPGWLCSKEQIFENVWHEDSESSLVAIANTISRIRQKIESDKEHLIYIQTVSSLGRPSQILCKPPMWCRIEAPHFMSIMMKLKSVSNPQKSTSSPPIKSEIDPWLTGRI